MRYFFFLRSSILRSTSFFGTWTSLRVNSSNTLYPSGFFAFFLAIACTPCFVGFRNNEHAMWADTKHAFAGLLDGLQSPVAPGEARHFEGRICQTHAAMNEGHSSLLPIVERLDDFVMTFATLRAHCINLEGIHFRRVVNNSRPEQVPTLAFADCRHIGLLSNYVAALVLQPLHNDVAECGVHVFGCNWPLGIERVVDVAVLQLGEFQAVDKRPSVLVLNDDCSHLSNPQKPASSWAVRVLQVSRRPINL